MDDQLVLDLAATIRHDGHGGVADDLNTPAGLTRWLRERPEDSAVSRAVDIRRYTADEEALRAVREVRTAARALFARAVAPGPPSRADAGRLPAAGTALDVLAAAAARVPTVPRLLWPADGQPVVVREWLTGAAESGPAERGPVERGVAEAGQGPGPADRLAAVLAEAAMAFLAGPGRELLRACPAPRCVRYFVKEHPRQEWCKPSCGNRARVARHHARRRAVPPEGGAGG
ncbi:ABATE domain-containing protein [Streptomyces albus]|uniref:ABATE domain-containing protein n=1 Tax=Streptomyces albus TaxID=1888 RepID=UPI000ADF2CE5|nr:ABATE domain-containing protein [Streptomyces albus]